MSDIGQNKPGPGRPSAEEVARRAAAAQRPPVHDARAEARPVTHDAAHEKPRTRTRQNRATIDENPFNIPKNEIPEGLRYEWKRYSVGGQHDPFYLASMRRQGWEPVSPSVHPNWVPPGFMEPYIIREGLILMERPEELSVQAEEEVKGLSKQQMREAEQRLGMTPKGEMTREHPGLNKYGQPVVKEWGRSVPVEE